MPHISIIPDGDACWPELGDKQMAGKLINAMGGEGGDGPEWKVAFLSGGMQSGAPSVTLRIDLPDGTTFITETSAKLWVSVARALIGKFPELKELLL